MPFYFRFQTLLQHREFLLKKAQVALAAALGRLESLRARREQLAERIDGERRAWDERQTMGVSAAEYVAYGHFMYSLERQLLRFEGELRRIAEEVAKARAFLADKERELKAMELLREKDQEDYTLQRLRKEQGQSDEVAIFKQFRRDLPQH